MVWVTVEVEQEKNNFMTIFLIFAISWALMANIVKSRYQNERKISSWNITPIDMEVILINWTSNLLTTNLPSTSSNFFVTKKVKTTWASDISKMWRTNWTSSFLTWKTSLDFPYVEIIGNMKHKISKDRNKRQERLLIFIFRHSISNQNEESIFEIFCYGGEGRETQ